MRCIFTNLFNKLLTRMANEIAINRQKESFQLFIHLKIEFVLKYFWITCYMIALFCIRSELNSKNYCVKSTKNHIFPILYSNHHILLIILPNKAKNYVKMNLGCLFVILTASFNGGLPFSGLYHASYDSEQSTCWWGNSCNALVVWMTTTCHEVSVQLAFPFHGNFSPMLNEKSFELQNLSTNMYLINYFLLKLKSLPELFPLVFVFYLILPWNPFEKIDSQCRPRHQKQVFWPRWHLLRVVLCLCLKKNL